VAAVTVVTAMLLRVGNSIVERYYCSFEVNQHGCATGQMNKAELGCLLVPRWM